MIYAIRDFFSRLWLFLLMVPLALRFALGIALLYGGARRKERPPTAEDLAWERWEDQEIRRVEAKRSRPESDS